MSRQEVRTSYNIDRRNDSRRNNSRSNTYIEGNTVRKVNAVPQRDPREERERIGEREQRANRQVRENRRRAMQMSPGYVLFLTAAVALTLGVCAVFIQLQSEINTRMRNVASMESQILDLKTDNDATMNRIETSINMEDIKNAAIDQLGMVYPGQDQIVYFKVDANDYMNQYRDIPEK